MADFPLLSIYVVYQRIIFRTLLISFLPELTTKAVCLRDTITPSKKKDCSIFRRVANGGGSSRWVIFKAFASFSSSDPWIHDISHDKNPTAKDDDFFRYPKIPQQTRISPPTPTWPPWIGNGTVLTQQEIDFPPRSLCQEWHSVRCLGNKARRIIFPFTPGPSHPKSCSHTWWFKTLPTRCLDVYRAQKQNFTPE